MIRRAWSLLSSPDAAWAAIAAERPAVRRVLLGYAVPMSLLPALAWVAGSLLFPHDIGGAAGARTPAEIVVSGAWTFTGSLLTVLLLAGSLVLVAPAYGVGRRWGDAIRVAAYGLTPIWVVGLFMVKPMLVILLVAGALHCCFVLPPGVHVLLAVRSDEAAEYAAASAFATILGTMAFGGLFGYLQWL